MQARARAQELRAALGVVDRQPEHAGDDRREDAAVVVPERPAVDRAAEHLDARAEHELELRPLVEQPAEALELVERGREVRVPIPDVARPRVERGEEPLAHGLALAPVAGEAQHPDPSRSRAGEAVERGRGAVCAAVIHEVNLNTSFWKLEAREGLDVEAGRLVEAGHDERDRGLERRRVGAVVRHGNVMRRSTARYTQKPTSSTAPPARESSP